MPYGVFMHANYIISRGVYTPFNYWYNGLLYTYQREASALLVLH